MLFINLASQKPQEQTHELGFHRAAKNCFQQIQEGKYNLMEMVHADDFTGCITSEAVNLEAVIALVMERTMEGFSAVDNNLLNLYTSHIERLVRHDLLLYLSRPACFLLLALSCCSKELQVRGNPKRRLLRDINTAIEELETITAILVRQDNTLNEFLQLLRSDGRLYGMYTQRLDISILEQTMRTN